MLFQEKKKVCQNMLSARKQSLLPWRTVSNDDRMKVVAIGTNSNYSSPGSSHSADVSGSYKDEAHAKFLICSAYQIKPQRVQCILQE